MFKSCAVLRKIVRKITLPVTTVSRFFRSHLSRLTRNKVPEIPWRNSPKCA